MSATLPTAERGLVLRRELLRQGEVALERARRDVAGQLALVKASFAEVLKRGD